MLIRHNSAAGVNLRLQPCRGIWMDQSPEIGTCQDVWHRMTMASNGKPIMVALPWWISIYIGFQWLLHHFKAHVMRSRMMQKIIKIRYILKTITNVTWCYRHSMPWGDLEQVPTPESNALANQIDLIRNHMGTPRKSAMQIHDKPTIIIYPYTERSINMLITEFQRNHNNKAALTKQWSSGDHKYENWKKVIEKRLLR